MRVVEVAENIDIIDLSHDGRGIAKIDGKVVFVDGALPQEVVHIQYLKRKKDFDEAKVTEVIKASNERVEPKCPHFGTCGGCSLQHLSAEGQVHFKQKHWLQLMDKMGGGLPEETLPALQDTIWHYRRKARLGVKHVAKKGKTLIGFREKHHPQYLIDMQECWILEERVAKAFPKLQTLINRMPSAANIAQIEMTAGTEVALVFRKLKPLTKEDESLIIEFGQSTGFKLYLQPKGPETVQLFYPPDATFQLNYPLQFADTSIAFEPLDFIQVNASLNDAMIQQALDLLDLNDNDVLLDLFCGLGNFTLPLAKRVKHVFGVEGYAPMIERAKRNAQALGFTNIDFSVADLQKTESVEALESLPFNKILLDPPRDGALAVVQGMGRLNPERIVYVSCHPATLARDAEILRVEFGYRMIKGGVMDMFPHTGHVESMALFVK